LHKKKKIQSKGETAVQERTYVHVPDNGDSESRWNHGGKEDCKINKSLDISAISNGAFCARTISRPAKTKRRIENVHDHPAAVAERVGVAAVVKDVASVVDVLSGSIRWRRVLIHSTTTVYRSRHSRTRIGAIAHHHCRTVIHRGMAAHDLLLAVRRSVGRSVDGEASLLQLQSL